MVKYVVTSPLSLARVLWWYAEDRLWPEALVLHPVEVAQLAPRFGELLSERKRVDDLWPEAPTEDAHLLLGAIEHLEGVARPAARRHRRRGRMPDSLDIGEDGRWRDPALGEVIRFVDEQTGSRSNPTQPWLRPRLHGRWAPG